MTTPTAATGHDERDPVLRSFALGPRWPTIDPFLFVAHHDDAYPAATEAMTPDASLAGRRLGMDFSQLDGWSMYHGTAIPGFPQHPHRGFETITHVRRGHIDHADSLGATARFGPGDTQWMTAGSGIVHAEMFPLLDTGGPNPLELFQIWLNLPATDKLVDPYFTMLWNESTPRRTSGHPGAGTAEVTVIAGRLPGGEGEPDLEPPAPPPNSWAARTEADVAIWHLALRDRGDLSLPPAAGPATRRAVYVYGGGPIALGSARTEVAEVGVGIGVEVVADRPIRIASLGAVAECLVLQGRPIGEPVVQHGPFVMNDEAGIIQTFEDYRRTGFGGWPWPTDDPVHARSAGRFARHADGRVERVP